MGWGWEGLAVVVVVLVEAGWGQEELVGGVLAGEGLVKEVLVAGALVTTVMEGKWGRCSCNLIECGCRLVKRCTLSY